MEEVDVLIAKTDKNLIFCHYKTEHRHKNRYMCCVLSNGTNVKFKNLRLEDFIVIKKIAFKTISGKKYFTCKKGVYSSFGNLITDNSIIQKMEIKS